MKRGASKAKKKAELKYPGSAFLFKMRINPIAAKSQKSKIVKKTGGEESRAKGICEKAGTKKVGT